MSFNRVFPHPEDAYVEAVIDGHEDWQSALAVIEDMMACASDHDLSRIILDFSTVDMRVAVKEAPDIARLFDSFAPTKMQLGIIPPGPEIGGREVVEAFAAQISDLGHATAFLDDDAKRADWIAGRLRPQRVS